MAIVTRIIYKCEVCSKVHYIKPTGCKCDSCKNYCMADAIRVKVDETKAVKK